MRKGAGKQKLVNGVIGAIISVLLSIGMLFVISSLALSGRVGESQSDIFVCILMAVATAIGGVIASRMTKVRSITIPLMSSGMYGVILAITGMLAIEGPFTGLVKGIGMIGLGSAISCLVIVGKKEKKRKRKMTYR